MGHGAGPGSHVLRTLLWEQCGGHYAACVNLGLAQLCLHNFEPKHATANQPHDFIKYQLTTLVKACKSVLKYNRFQGAARVSHYLIKTSMNNGVHVVASLQDYNNII